MTREQKIQLGTTSVPAGDFADHKIYAVWGHPISHSWSPGMHQLAFDELGLQATYLAFDVTRQNLAAAMKSLREYLPRYSWGGMNLTLPLKQEIIPYLDGVHATAKLAGAVNTVHVQTGDRQPILMGYNTDVLGVQRTLQENSLDLADKTAVVLGAGGAARAATVALLQQGPRNLRIVNRTVSNARMMIDAILQHWTGPEPHISLHPMKLSPDFYQEVDIVIQTTSLGLKPSDPLPSVLEGACERLFVLEAIYNPARTRFLQAAEKLGLRSTNGLSMLLHQGVGAFELWTGQKPPVEKMRDYLLALESNNPPSDGS